ncbi:RNAse Z [bacterium]|nr:MAG: RNAse Z [bacterium]
MKIAAYSTALYSTWIFIEELRLLFDAGDGVAAMLEGKGRKAKTVALTHSDRDHVTGLLQLQQLHVRHNGLRVLYPADSRGIPLLADFCRRFDPWAGPYVNWERVLPDERVGLEGDLVLVPVQNTHIPGKEVRSLGYKIVRRVRKLKPELVGTPGEVLATMDRDAATDEIERPVLAFSGDTGPMEPDTWRDQPILIHEATFLRQSDVERGPERTQLHSCLDEVLDLARAAKPERLILTHLSPRYHEDEAREAIAQMAAEMRVTCPIWLVPPSRVVWDVFQEAEVWKS